MEEIAADPLLPQQLLAADETSRAILDAPAADEPLERALDNYRLDVRVDKWLEQQDLLELLRSMDSREFSAAETYLQ